MPTHDLTRRALLLGGMVAGLCSTVGAPSAGAVFRGPNGKIAVMTQYDLPCGDCDAAGQRVWVLAQGRLTAWVDGWNPTFSPSGSRIAWATGDGIAVNRLDGSDPVFRQGLTEPSWSPAGGELAYRGDYSQLVGVAQANGKHRRQLRMIRGPFAWAPNGRELAWIDWARSSIQAIGSDGNGLRQLVALDETARSSLVLDWLPSGWLAYWGGPLSPAGEGALFINRPDNAERQLVTRMTLDYYADTYSWSPTGRRIAFLRDGGLWVATVPDGDEQLLVPAGKAGELPQWSPDGRLIAYVKNHRVMTVPAAGGQPRQFARFNDRRSGEEYAVDIDWQRRPARK
jgi:Tol biopolymer transport system component